MGLSRFGTGYLNFLVARLNWILKISITSLFWLSIVKEHAANRGREFAETSGSGDWGLYQWSHRRVVIGFHNSK
jgi:hypothetical protein